MVGDDAQAIYAFRAATVRNILDFPQPVRAAGAAVVTLEQNYRSTQPILDAANAVIGLAPRALRKQLFSTRARGAAAGAGHWSRDELAQVELRRPADPRATARPGSPLREQAVLFRAAHHSAALELELARRNIPFVKYGGLKFLEAAHVKDVLAFLRWAENPRDRLAGFRVAAAAARASGPAPRAQALDALRGRPIAARAARAFGRRRRPPSIGRGSSRCSRELRARALAGAARAGRGASTTRCSSELHDDAASAPRRPRPARAAGGRARRRASAS